MLQWVPTKATILRSDIVIGRLVSCFDRRQTFMTMKCERSGKYKAFIQNLKHDDTGMRKCECPFKLFVHLKANNTWTFNVICGMHNHALCYKLATHSNVSCLNSDEKLILDMTLDMVKPKNILSTLKWKIPKSVSNIRQVYNINTQNNKAKRGPRSKMQQMVKLLNDDHYIFRYIVCEDGNTIQDIFFTHLDSIKLFNNFPIVLIIDSTYKTNKYKLPLLKIIGFTSTYMTFAVVFAFLESESEDSFTLAFKMSRIMLKDQQKYTLSLIVIPY